DLELNLAYRHRKQRPQFRRGRMAKVDREPRQQGVDQPRLARAQLVTLAPTKESARLNRRIFVHRPSSPAMTNCQRKLRLSASARSVRSQEKPPSFSGARPKWPYAAVRR